MRLPKPSEKEKVQNKLKKRKPKPLIKVAEELWKQAVRKRDKNTCRKCKIIQRKDPITDKLKPSMVQHHIHSRRHKATFLEIDNGLNFCNGCHGYVHRWMHPADYEREMKKIMNPAIYDKMKVESNKIKILDAITLGDKVNELEELLKE